MSQLNIHQVLGSEVGQKIIDKMSKIEEREVSGKEALGLALERLIELLDDSGNLTNGGSF